MRESVEQEIISLSKKTVPELKEMYSEHFATGAPPYNKKYLIDKIAYRMQEIVYGKLSKEAEKKLNYLADREEEGKKVSSEKLPIAGTRLMKEYKGRNHDVLVTDVGFIYQGQFFTSLSAIARKITGMSYNGPLFFGLRSNKKNLTKIGEKE
ncbi:DUF2924 domain-containing protein [Wolbachia endosymbiont of Pentalonia nigronervosa]|jgi:hypothetical protein|uniref:DUF2924 domain-containing protein n=1 Tax=Wolbachia endosymbiont of Pentalonia nigronervosa TaxID=1301914 RepID=UPI00165F8A83|nr:DUF2924 domain-containing protein [Wolbachia endosymbiont of Pentalonia nigronervosa]MBD0390980.1 DUF2924 domain-containing protein [Wolbachia endosymbiont of Pentalonia nigronervosa]